MMNCTVCKSQFDVDARRLMRCGYEQPHDAGTAWVHPGQDCKRPDICPGYLCGLPEVHEVSYARMHWDRGHLREWSDGAPTRQLMEAIEVLEVATNASESWSMKNPPKGRTDG